MSIFKNRLQCGKQNCKWTGNLPEMEQKNNTFFCPKCGNGEMKDIADSIQNDRVEHANELIKLIANCGRKFFRHGETIAHMEIDKRGKVWFVDEYTRRRVYTHYRHEWRGFNNGGTMRALIEKLRNYITKSETLNPHIITPKRFYTDESNIWGYEPSEAEKLRQAAWKLPMFKQEKAA